MERLKTEIVSPILGETFTADDVDNCVKTMIDAIIVATHCDEKGETNSKMAIDILIVAVAAYYRGIYMLTHKSCKFTNEEIFEALTKRSGMMDEFVPRNEEEAES